MKLLAALVLLAAAGAALAAATIERIQDQFPRPHMACYTETEISVAQSGNTSIYELRMREFERLYIQVAVTGQNLDAFIVQARAHGSGSYQTLYSTAGNYTSPTGILVGTSGDLTAITAGSSGWLILDVRGLDAVKLLASSGNAAGSTVAVYGCAR